MAKSKKKRQQDFQKVKLKVGKVLKKADNVTNASFKTRTIQVTQQLKSHDGLQPTTHKKQSITDLLTQCRHYSASNRLDSVTGLRELIMAHSEIATTHLATILDKTSKLFIDKDASTRKGLIRLYKIFLPNVPEKQISPFFPLLCAHLCCAMTHIVDDIQVDSLALLDLLLETYPKLMVYKSNQVLSNFVEQISRQQSQGQQKTARSLATNPNSKTSSLKWRTSVLNKLQKFLSAILQCHTVAMDNTRTADTAMEESDWSVEKGVRLEVFPSTFRHQWEMPGFTISTTAIDQPSEGGDIWSGKFQEFMKTLVPLLLECWVESAPSQQLSNGAGNLLSVDSVAIMSSILSVTQLLWDCMALVTAQETVTVPVSKYVRDFQQHFLASFPFSVHTPASRADGKNKHTEQISAESLNLAICDIMTNFLCQRANQQSERKPSANQQLDSKSAWLSDVTSYLIGFLNGEYDGRLIGQNSSIVVKILQRLVINAQHTDQLEDLLSTAYRRYRGAHYMSTEKRVYLKFFADISLVQQTKHVLSEELRVQFLSTLPKLLRLVAKDNPQVAALLIGTMKKAACQKCTYLLDGICKKSKSLFHGDSGAIIHLQPRAQRDLIGLLYYLPHLDDAALLRSLTSLTKSRTFHESEVAFLLQVLHNRYLASSIQSEKVVHYLGFLATLLVGFTKEEISQLEVPQVAGQQYLGRFQIVYASQAPDEDSTETWARHIYIVQLVCGAVQQCGNSGQVVDVLTHLLHSHVTSSSHVIRAETAYGICKLAESFRHCLPDGATSYIANLCISLVHQSAIDSELTNQHVWLSLREMMCGLLQTLPGGMKILLQNVLERVKSDGETCYSVMSKILAMFLSEGRRQLITPDCAQLMREVVSKMNTNETGAAEDMAMGAEKPWLVELQYLVALVK